MSDRYTKFVLTIIAAALVYICIVLTPVTAVSAQTALRPGDPTGPGQVVVVGWQSPQPVPVAFEQPVHVVADQPVRITGAVTTERTSGVADRVVVVGWEEGATRDRPSAAIRSFEPQQPPRSGLPVSQR